MKKLFFVLFVSILVWNCKPGASKQGAEVVAPEEVAVVCIDELMASPDLYVGKEISLGGLCIKTCKHSGKELFLQGTDESKLVVVFAEGEIGFDSELEGAKLIVKGMLSTVEKEAVCEGEGETEATGEDGHECETAVKEIPYKLSCVSYEVIIEEEEGVELESAE